MSKTLFVAEVANEAGVTKVVAKNVLDAMVTVVTRELGIDGESAIPGIGKLIAAERPARKGRNPKTGESVDAPASTTIRLRAASSLKSAVQ